VELARDRLKEAQQALLVVRQQAGEATVTAPFSGTITAVNVEVGQNVDALGLFGLVSDELEIRIDLDESNLADISLGQTALLVASDRVLGYGRDQLLQRRIGPNQLHAHRIRALRS
jgi:multidrug resistance efflux pump